MRTTIEVRGEGTATPPPGAPLLVQVRDTSVQDAPAVVLGEARGTVGRGVPLGMVEVAWQGTARSPTVWALVDVDADGRVSRGDWVTTVSYPVPASEGASVVVTVRRVE